MITTINIREDSTNKLNPKKNIIMATMGMNTVTTITDDLFWIEDII